MNTSTQVAAQTTTVTQPEFTATELHALQQLRTRYMQVHDFLSVHELARLRFLRWLVQTGRLAP
jgi:hypothetical protein